MNIFHCFNVCLLILLAFSANAQKKLVIRDAGNEKVREFSVGSRFLYMTQEKDFYSKGRIEEIRDTSIVLFLPEEEDSNIVEESIHQITLIRKPSKLHFAGYIAGVGLMLNGAFFILEGPDVTNKDILNRGIGVLSFGLGLIPFLVQPRMYEMGEKYFLHIEGEFEPDEDTGPDDDI